MIKNVTHARKVCARRAAAGKRGLPRAVVRWMRDRKRETYVPAQSRWMHAEQLELAFNPPL